MLKRSILAFAVLTFAVGCQSNKADDASDAPETNRDATQEFRAAEGERTPTAEDSDDTDADDSADANDDASELAKNTDNGKSVISEDILTRDTLSDRAEVQHVLISWDEQASTYAQRGGQDPRGAERSKKDADKLALSILQKAEEGEDFVELMRTYSEDPGSAKSGESYPVEPNASLVQPFKDLSLRLKPEETGVVQSDFGYHVIYRVR